MPSTSELLFKALLIKLVNIKRDPLKNYVTDLQQSARKF